MAVNGKGFLGTNASLLADLTLILSLCVAVVLTIGVFMAIKKRFAIHRWLQTTAVALNAILVLIVMIGSFSKSVVPGVPKQLDQPYYAIASIHGIIGLIAFVFGSFVALRGNELVPAALKFNNYKRFMRIAYGLYMLATALGVWVYITWYTQTPVTSTPQPTADQPGTLTVPMINFVFNPEDIVVPVGTTVVWVNNDAAPHTATADDGLAFDSGQMATSETFSFTFNELGEFPYYCVLHGSPGGIDMAGTIKVVAADQAPDPVAVSAATATPQPTPHPLPTQFFGEPTGVAAFRDIRAHNDGIVIELIAKQPASSEQLVAFLSDSSGDTTYALGALEFVEQTRASLEFTDPNGENLLGRFRRVIITQEANPGASPSGPIVFEGELPAESFVAIQNLLVEGPGLPEKEGHASRMRGQTDEVVIHIDLLTKAYQRDDIPAVNRHAEHLYNLITGSEDAQYGDLNADGQAQNPGDGFGMLPNGDQAGYLGATAEAALEASNAADATEAIKVHADHVRICTDNMTEWSVEVRDIAQELSRADGSTALDSGVNRLGVLATALGVGLDVNGDGYVTPAPGECGARVAYEHAQYMAGIGLYPVEP